MDLQSFRQSLEEMRPPPGLGPALQGLWWDAKGDWNQAHDCAQTCEDAACCRVHAYLHRKEGDLANAGYWYERAGLAAPQLSLAQEWEEVARSLLAEG
jgi:hypothetical protein